MPATVLLKGIVDALLEIQFDESSSFLDLENGRVETVSVDLLRYEEESVDEAPELPAWQEDEWETAKRIASTDRFLSLPSKFDVHEWEIMEELSHSVASARIREDLLNAIHGLGAFRHFKGTLRRHRVEEAWFAFRTEALKQIAIDCCEEHLIAWQ
jgi:hypothetical protein